jgi:serine/threonine protein kinase
MISKHGEVKLMDFGIARDDKLSDLTETGTGLGTPSYMSPEQILGDKLDFRSDIFSLGIVLFQMATGRKPFVEDDSRTVMQKIGSSLHEPAQAELRVPRALEPDHGALHGEDAGEPVPDDAGADRRSHGLPELARSDQPQRARRDVPA